MPKYAPGKIVLFSEGEYSDYGYCGHVVTLQECDFAALAEDYKKAFKAKDDWDRAEPSSFVAWLCARQYCAEINVNEVYLGAYGRLTVQ
ncbi:hypothetical protein [Sphingomonas baiyangensis]|uniref:Uncharacterized protein n=1 Tax=Sphingomonas baiyangensis TaxID=2572576 RepID=A0A4U1L0B8_9SPHN|nr:hypothetical protein [Sphingomonas baiyangensis]TKD50181.1 hypothetical protein FBR43_04995 [Sphingomonas baiyangensis]